jgi:hypothetical protein
MRKPALLAAAFLAMAAFSPPLASAAPPPLVPLGTAPAVPAGATADGSAIPEMSRSPSR